MYRKLLPLHEKVLGCEHPDTLRTRNNLVGAIYEQGRAAEAEAMWRELLPLREKVLGPEHPDTLRARNNLAAAINAQAPSAEAENILPAALRPALACGQPYTRTSEMALAQIREDRHSNGVDGGETRKAGQ